MATGASWAKPSLPGPPWRAHRRPNDGGNPELFEGKRSTDDGLHENPEGEASKVRLIIEAVGRAEEVDVDGEIGVEVEEGSPRLTP
jgi:hypothetical protein